MSNQLIRGGLISLILASLAAAEAAAQSVIAHWSFDTATITTDANGILTAADQTGNHNATRTSAATGVRPINSVAGQFGQGAEFTNLIDVETGGASQLQFTNLTEIMGAGGGDFSIAAWAKTAAVGQDNTIISDWSGTNTYWFQLDAVDSNTAARPRAQIRNTTGADLVAATLSATETGLTNVADGSWHHYAWTWAKTAGTMSFYVDGVLHAGATRTTGQADHNLRASTNVNAHLGWKQDSNDHFSGTMDEVWVANGVLTPTQIQDGFNNNFANTFQPPVDTNLSLEVNAVSGAVTIRNTTAGPIAISAYRITSSGQSLDTSGWDPVATGVPVDGFPQGTGNGDGWELAPNASAKEIAEWFLTSSSTIAATNGFVSLGSASFPTVNVGDHDNNGIVDTADYVLWRKNGLDQTQYDHWRSNYGKRKGTQDLVFQYTLGDGTVKTGTVDYVTTGVGAVLSVVSVPETGTAGMLLIAVLFGVLGRGNRVSCNV